MYGVKKILAVDDDAAMRYLLNRFLSQAGYEVTVAIDGDDALRSFQEFPADLLITDLNMPGMGGLELIERMMASNSRPQIIVISGDNELMKKLRSSPAFASVLVIAKPFDPATLLSLVHELLASAAQTRA